jgi:hypothetical protein
MSLISYDLEKLYAYTFGGRPYQVNPSNPNVPVNDQLRSNKGLLQDKYLNHEIWLPVTFTELDKTLFETGKFLLPYTVISISGKKTIVKTPLAERKGTVKELYNVDDYDISLKGFLIDEDKRLWPESQIESLKEIFEKQLAVGLDNALTNIFLGDQGQRVVIESLDFPPVEGGRKHIRPFSMKIESDSVFTLELK